MPNLTPGVCRHCHCTEDRACLLQTGGGETCSWTDRTRLVCNAPACVKAEAARVATVKASRPRRLSPAEVHQLIVGRGRKSRASKGSRL